MFSSGEGSDAPPPRQALWELQTQTGGYFRAAWCHDMGDDGTAGVHGEESHWPGVRERSGTQGGWGTVGHNARDESGKGNMATVPQLEGL